MIHKTNGILLHQLRYSDHSRVVHMYTEAFGRITLMARISRAKKSVTPASLFQPLSLLEIEFYYRPGREIQNLKEVKSRLIYQSIPYDQHKRSIALFLGEVLYKSLREEEPNPSLFEFLFHALQFFDETISSVSIFHLWFLLQLTRFLGFFPENNHNDETRFFDLQNGIFTGNRPMHRFYTTPETGEHISQLLKPGTHGEWELKWNAHQRKDLLEQILLYYQLHLDGFDSLKTLPVLTSIFHGT